MTTPCPKCGTPDAYVGFASVECSNPGCDNYSVKQEKLLKIRKLFQAIFDAPVSQYTISQIREEILEKLPSVVEDSINVTVTQDPDYPTVHHLLVTGAVK